MSVMMMRRRRAAKNKGFNLIEAAIVLGIVGLVVGGIWVAATSVYANLRSKTGTDQLLKIAQSVRSLYATSANMGNTAADVTQDVARANVLPGDVMTASTALTTSANTVNPWNGRVGIVANAAANATAFAVVFSNIPSSACVDFVLRNVGTSHDTGMTAVYYGANGAVNALPGANIAVVPGAAITLANAQLACDSAAGTIRNIGFLFNLRG